MPLIMTQKPWMIFWLVECFSYVKCFLGYTQINDLPKSYSIHHHSPPIIQNIPPPNHNHPQPSKIYLQHPFTLIHPKYIFTHPPPTTTICEKCPPNPSNQSISPLTPIQSHPTIRMPTNPQPTQNIPLSLPTHPPTHKKCPITPTDKMYV